MEKLKKLCEDWKWAMNVLVMEDDGELASFVLDGLQQLGHSVRSTANGHEAFAYATLRNRGILDEAEMMDWVERESGFLPESAAKYFR